MFAGITPDIDLCETEVWEIEARASMELNVQEALEWRAVKIKLLR